MSADIEFKDNIGLVHLVTRKCYGWAQALGVPMDYEDVFQEASMAFVTAARSYDPTVGTKFSAYFSRAAFNQVRKAIGQMTGVKQLDEAQRENLRALKEENELRAASGEKQLSTYSGLRMVSISDLETEEGENLYDVIASDAATPEEICSARQDWDEASKDLSPLARLMADWLRDPPEELLREVEGQRAHYELRKSGGQGRGQHIPGISMECVGNFMQLVVGIRREEVMLAESELLKAAKSL